MSISYEIKQVCSIAKYLCQFYEHFDSLTLTGLTATIKQLTKCVGVRSKIAPPIIVSPIFKMFDASDSGCKGELANISRNICVHNMTECNIKWVKIMPCCLV